MKKLLAIVASLVFLFSCGTTSVLTKSELVGKTFSPEGYKASLNPEEGGVPFIKFTENNAEYLTGDILNNAKYEVKEGKIICNNEQFNKIVTFTIIDSKTIKDEYNTIWKIK